MIGKRARERRVKVWEGQDVDSFGTGTAGRRAQIDRARKRAAPRHGSDIGAGRPLLQSRRHVGALGALVLIGLAVAGCNTTAPRTSAGSSRACLADNPRFADAWNCIRARTVAHSGGIRDSFVQEGDILAEQVRSGKVSEADARKRLSAGLAHEPGS